MGGPQPLLRPLDPLEASLGPLLWIRQCLGEAPTPSHPESLLTGPEKLPVSASVSAMHKPEFVTGKLTRAPGVKVQDRRQAAALGLPFVLSLSPSMSQASLRALPWQKPREVAKFPDSVGRKESPNFTE